jgi:hypothetical protein
VGDRVKLMFGGHEVTGVVIEDRGLLGVGGRRLLRVRLETEDGEEPVDFEVRAEDVQVAA